MSASDQTSELRPLERRLILAVMTASTALYAMTVTIANVALPTMQGSFAATPDQIAWVVTFNIIATAVGTPLSGWLAARFGARRVLIGCLLSFTVFSLLCGFANSLTQLVLFRIGQGLFGAPIAPLAQAMVLATAIPGQQGRATAIFGMGVVLGPVLAPSIGGYLTEVYSWRWVFFLMVPIGALCAIAMAWIVRERPRAEREPFDWTGFLSLAIAIAALQLMLDRGERNDWFESTETWIEAIIVVMALYLFAVQTLTATRPFLSRVLFTDRNFVIGMFVTICFGMLNVTPMVLLPTMLQRLQGYPDSIIGIVLGARACGTLLGFFILMFGNKLDPRIWLVLGFSLQGIAAMNMTSFTMEVSLQEVMLSMAVQGLGVGLLWVPITMITFSTLNQALFSQGMSIFHLLRNTSSSAHISISVAILLSSTQANYASLGGTISEFNEVLRLPNIIGQYSIDNSASLSMISNEIQLQASMIGYLNAFYFYAITALIALPLIMLVRKR